MSISMSPHCSTIKSLFICSLQYIKGRTGNSNTLCNAVLHIQAHLHYFPGWKRGKQSKNTTVYKRLFFFISGQSNQACSGFIYSFLLLHGVPFGSYCISVLVFCHYSLCTDGLSVPSVFIYLIRTGCIFSSFPIKFILNMAGCCRLLTDKISV